MLDQRKREIAERGYDCLEDSYVHWLDIYTKTYESDYGRASKALANMETIGECLKDLKRIMNGTIGHNIGSFQMGRDGNPHHMEGNPHNQQNPRYSSNPQYGNPQYGNIQYGYPQDSQYEAEMQRAQSNNPRKQYGKPREE